MKYIRTFENFQHSLLEFNKKPQLQKLFAGQDILDNGKYRDLLIHYIESQSNLDRDEFADLVKYLLDNRNEYGKLLKPRSGYAYRGTSITPDIYSEIRSGKTTLETGYTVIQAPYESASAAQSWTLDFRVAQRFADRGLFNNPRLEKGARGAIIRASIDDSFVGSPAMTHDIADTIGLKAEKEIFHWGYRIKDAEWMISTADISLGRLDQ